MKIAIYHPWIYVKSGLERSLMEIKNLSRHEWTLFTHHYDPEGTYPELKSMGVVELGRVSVKRQYGAVGKAALTLAGTRLDLKDYDALVICCDGLGSLLCFRNHDIPVVCLCYTPLRAVYDPEYRRRHLQRFHKIKPLAMAFEMLYRWVDRLAWRYYRAVIYISENVRRRAQEGKLPQPALTPLAYAGISKERRIRSDLFENFFFLPGRIMWTKNIELGIRAFKQFRQRTGKPFELRIAGMVDAKSQAYFAELKTLAGDEPNIVFMNDLTDSEMDDLYHRCYAVLFTPFNEDQGLVPLEAMAHGKPVIAVNRGGPRELVRHQETGLLVEDTPEAFGAAMERLAGEPDLARSIGASGFLASADYTWDRFVGKIDDTLEKVVEDAANR